LACGAVSFTEGPLSGVIGLLSELGEQSHHRYLVAHITDSSAGLTVDDIEVAAAFQADAVA
jgi:hypothetical protein